MNTYRIVVSNTYNNESYGYNHIGDESAWRRYSEDCEFLDWCAVISLYEKVGENYTLLSAYRR
jgi:hypothetical protein